MKYFRTLTTLFLLLSVIVIHTDTMVGLPNVISNNVNVLAIDGNKEFTY